MHKVIALAGAKGSGKDTVALFIKKNLEERHLDCQLVAFADPIKEKIKDLFNLDTSSNEEYDLFKRGIIHCDVNTWADEAYNKVIPARHIVRDIGMLMRSYDESQFINYVKRKIESDHKKVWIVTDMRFENEYSLLKDEYNARMIKVKRDLADYDGHATEIEFSDYRIRYLIDNNKSRSDLENETIKVLEAILKEWQ